MKQVHLLRADHASQARRYILPCTHHRQCRRKTLTHTCITRQRRRLSGVAASAKMSPLRTSPRSKTNISDMAVFQQRKGFLSVYFNTQTTSNSFYSLCWTSMVPVLVINTRFMREIVHNLLSPLSIIITINLLHLLQTIAALLKLFTVSLISVITQSLCD